MRDANIMRRLAEAARAACQIYMWHPQITYYESLYKYRKKIQIGSEKKTQIGSEQKIQASSGKKAKTELNAKKIENKLEKTA